MALSQVPTCKFSTANIHKNICDVFISTCLEQYIHIVVDDAIVILHINKVCRHSCHHVKKKTHKNTSLSNETEIYSCVFKSLNLLNQI